MVPMCVESAGSVNILLWPISFFCRNETLSKFLVDESRNENKNVTQCSCFLITGRLLASSPGKGQISTWKQ